ncbi:DUF2069 domain-containing protein [Aliagarivorans taiwanensis]|uniref:DUF2069 domain-containing protein n=1 Tax=Aliagarivorans taiwanensis TaxID=561966 RepID=UPI00042364BB|nr:DUF2069 domain-containing protein [Aliagarivorans taiwanensis]
MAAQQWLRLAQLSYLGLLIWVALWQLGVLASADTSLGFRFALWLLPLLFPLPGIAKGKPYTFAWASFVLLWYVLHAAVLLVVAPELRLLAAVELVLTLSAFVSGLVFARTRGRELGLGLKKRKKGE